MKLKVKFFAVVSALVLVSSAVLATCMWAIVSKSTQAKEYNIDYIPQERPLVNGGVEDEEAPNSQASLKKKFSAMASVDEENNTITVITEDFLKEYWESNYEKKEIKSLTIDEVLYIIQDSINIFYKYDQVILPGFGLKSSFEGDSSRFPHVTARTYSTVRNRQENIKQIYNMIWQRLKLLSSPEAFCAIICLEDCKELSLNRQGIQSFENPERDCIEGFEKSVYSLLYIPGITSENEADFNALKNSAGFGLMASPEGLNEEITKDFPSFFEFSLENKAEINFVSQGKINKIYPTSEMNGGNGHGYGREDDVDTDVSTETSEKSSEDDDNSKDENSSCSQTGNGKGDGPQSGNGFGNGTGNGKNNSNKTSDFTTLK